MAERSAEVVAVDADHATLRAVGQCSDCVGCGGRCSLFISDSHGLVQVSLGSLGRVPGCGERVVLVLPEGWLARAALGGYGVPLLGLMLGGGAGQALSAWTALPGDALVLAGAALGTLTAFAVSKAEEPRLRVRIDVAAPADAPVASLERPPST